MPSNKRGGKKHKRGKKDVFENRTLILRDSKEGQEYAQVKKVNGSGRYNLFCFDGTERLGISAGNIKRKVRIQIYDIVLISKWDFQDNKCSIVHKYEEDEVQELKRKNEFPKNIKLDGDSSMFSEDLDDSIQFNYDMPEEDEPSEKDKKESSSSDEEDFFVDVNDI
tara:strand:+ start:596 stop:1093 length:498 start_codon:yes stop_codon:yes gene_type:complete